jgi:hypothetical protein
MMAFLVYSGTHTCPVILHTTLTYHSTQFDYFRLSASDSVAGSKYEVVDDSVSYHVVYPGGTACSDCRESSVFSINVLSK